MSRGRTNSCLPAGRLNFKYKIFLAIFAFSLLLDMGAIFYVKNRRAKSVPSSTSESTINLAGESSDNSEQSISYYITTSQEFLNKARMLASPPSPSGSGEVKQTAEDKQLIIATINQALDLTNQAIAAYPSDDRSFAQRAKIYEALIPFVNQAIGLSIQDLRTAVDLNGQNPDYHLRLAGLYLQAGDLNLAASSFYNAYLLSPTDTQSLYNLADTLEKSGELAKANHYFDKLISLLPANNENLDTLKNRRQNIQKLLTMAKMEILTEPGNVAPAASKQTSVETELIGTQELPLEQAAIKSNVIIASGESPAASANTSPGLATIAVNAKSGEGLIPAGQTSVTINNVNVANNQQIIVSAEDNRQNKVLFVSARKAGSWFKISLDSPSSQEIKFSWWIVD